MPNFRSLEAARPKPQTANGTLDDTASACPSVAIDGGLRGLAELRNERKRSGLPGPRQSQTGSPRRSPPYSDSAHNRSPCNSNGRMKMARHGEQLRFARTRVWVEEMDSTDQKS
jgi:hypothetical protein